MELLIFFIAYTILFYATYKIIFWFKNRKKKMDLHKMMEIYLLEHKYKVDIKKVGTNKIINIVCLSNALIFAVVITSTMLIDNIIIRLLLMFLLLIPTTFLVYNGIGSYLPKKGKDKDV